MAETDVYRLQIPEGYAPSMDILETEKAIKLLKDTFAAGADFSGPMPGKSEVECGNYINLDVELARQQCVFYRDIIRNWTEADLSYEK